MEAISTAVYLNPFLTSTPAMIALIIKAGIYLYARHSNTHNYRTRLYLLFLFALSIQNIAEIAHFYVLADGIIPTFEITAYYAASIVAILLLFHLSIALSWEHRWPGLARWVYGIGYVYGFTVLALLVTSGLIIQGFEPIAYTVTRIPGPFYYLFEFLVLVLCCLVMVFFFVGAVYADSSRQRAQNALLLVAVIPIIAIVAVVLTLLHFGFRWLNASVVLPLGITLFLLVSAYAIHQHRIFDIQFFLPWSKVRRRKTRFHNRIRRLISEIADLPSPGDLVMRLSDTLRCSVVLLGSAQPAYTGAGAQRMKEIPSEVLCKVDEIVVAQEIADTKPNICRVMTSHKIAAIVPFHPHNSDAAGWLLLGNSFEDNVYSELDFRVVEGLFGRMSELFLDKFAQLRSEIRLMREGVQTLEAENQTLKALLDKVRDADGPSVQEHGLIYTGDSTVHSVSEAVRLSCGCLNQSITLLGRDRNMVRALRHEFQDVKAYVDVSSKAFQRSAQPEILVCRVDGDLPELAHKLHGWKNATAVLLYGLEAKEFATKYCDMFAGGLVDIVDGADLATLISRLRALLLVCRHCVFVRNHDVPLIGNSPIFRSYIRNLQLHSKFKDLLLVDHGADLEQFVESVRYMHDWAKLPGTPLVAEAAELAHATINGDGTIAIFDADLSVQATRQVFTELMKRNDSPRLILGCGCKANGLAILSSEFGSDLQVSSITMPKLAERTSDIGFLLHYFFLQFNVRSPVSVSYGQTDVDAMLASNALSSIGTFRQAIFQRFCDQARQVIQMEVGHTLSEIDIDFEQSGRSLAELVGDFEARIIRQTLDRCGGNKAKTSRVLGLRPNTLHYKIERYGLSGTTDPHNAGPRG